MRTGSAAASPAAGTLQVHNARSPGRPCPHVPVPKPRRGGGRWPAAPVTRLGSTSEPEPEGPRGLARTSSLGAAPLPAGKALASSTFAAHDSRVPDTARRQERAGNTGQDTLTRTADLRTEQGAALGRPGAGSPAPGACTGWGVLAHRAGETARPRGAATADSGRAPGSARRHRQPAEPAPGSRI